MRPFVEVTGAASFGRNSVNRATELPLSLSEWLIQCDIVGPSSVFERGKQID
jgi:hypothetical protein